MFARRDSATALGVFALAAALLWWLAGQRLVFINDEGIYLEGARRMMAGEWPYKDFFALTGPGVYWNVYAAFQLFGVSLASARAVLVADLAGIAAGLFWLGAKLHSRALGYWLAAFWTLLLAADAGGLVVNHRWDSAALTVLAAVFFVQANRSGKAWPLIAGGAAAAYAAWVTPPVLMVGAVMLVWAWAEQRWRGVGLFCAGGGAVSALAFGLLAATGTLVPMIQSLLWTTSQYSGPNRFPYGGIIGGYGNLFADASGLDFLVRGYFVFFFVLPAVVPIAAALALLAARPLWNRGMIFLLASGVAAVLGSAPRMDVAHLTYSAPLCYVVAGCALAALLPVRGRGILAGVLSFGACVMAWMALVQRPGLDSIHARAGRIVGVPAETRLLRSLEDSVRPGESFFAFPYIPIAYFLTQGANPTTYSYLQPGMMSEHDESTALASLQQSAPDRVLYMDVPPETYLRLFPSSDPARLRMRRIESWLRENYTRDEEFARANPGYFLLQRKVLASR